MLYTCNRRPDNPVHSRNLKEIHYPLVELMDTSKDRDCLDQTMPTRWLIWHFENTPIQIY